MVLRLRVRFGDLRPQRRAASGFGDDFQPHLMRRQFFFGRTNDPRWLTIGRQAADFGSGVVRALARAIAVGGITGQRQAGLATGHGQVDVGENLRVEQGAVQFTAGVVDAVTFAQGVKAVALPRVAFPGHHQGVEDAAVLRDVSAIVLPHQGEFVVDEANVERRVMDDQLRAFDELEELVGHFGETRLADEEFVGDAVDADRALVTFAIRLQVDVKVPARQAPTDQFDTADFNDPVTIGHRHAGGFGIEYY